MDVAITHSSTACVLLEIGSVRILTDPVLDDGRKWYRFAPTVWAQRYIGPAIRPGEIPPLDAVLLSHPHHLDNLDDSGRAMLREARQVISCRHDEGDLPLRAIRLEPWQETSIAGKNGERIRVTATPARHGPWWFPGVHKVIGFVLHWDGQEHGALYISGDTVYFRGMRRIASRFRIGTAILHLGAARFWPSLIPFVRFTMNAREAAKTAKLLSARTVIPIHYERSVWSHFRQPVEEYRREFDRAGVSNFVKWLDHGKRTLITV
jgi:L-ascorbate metabolism protein UlaG (beta-lactamase superfamily)